MTSGASLMTSATCLFIELQSAPDKPIFDLNVTPFDPPQIAHTKSESLDASLRFRVLFVDANQNADPPHPLGLRASDERKCDRSGANYLDELAPPHSITSLAVASSDGGTVRPSALAALRLMTNSNFVGACTGRSAGFSPLRMRST